MNRQRKWAVELNDGAPSRDVADPPGFSRSSASEAEDATNSRQKEKADSTWKQQKAWEVAQAPLKNLFMMGFMMYMSGNTVHIFSIGITISALWQPFTALQGVNKMFEPFQDARTDTLLPKLVYIAMNLVALAMGLYKLNSLGLLPTHASDWVSSLPPLQMAEVAGGGMPLL